MTRASDWVYGLRDFIFPLAQPLTSADRDAQRDAVDRRLKRRKRLIESFVADGDAMEPHLSACKGLLNGEDGRRQSVDTRLTTIVGLASIAGTIVFGSLLSQAGALRGTIAIRSLLAAGSLYLTLQICSAILAAVQGLGRRNYVELDPDDILPMDTEASTHHIRR
jgi:hypothetical protein